MPLRIKLPTKERIIINGAVIENAGEATTLVLLNPADVLRRKEVLQEKDAVTPARRVYYALQCAYAFFQERDKFLDSFKKLLDEYEEAAPSAASLCADIRQLVGELKFYNALRVTQQLIEHDTERLQHIGVLPGDDPSVEADASN